MDGGQIGRRRREVERLDDGRVSRLVAEEPLAVGLEDLSALLFDPRRIGRDCRRPHRCLSYHVILFLVVDTKETPPYGRAIEAAVVGRRGRAAVRRPHKILSRHLRRVIS